MNYQGMNILLVEDNEINQLMTQAFLQKFGIAVTVARHGKEALSKIVSKIFQVVLMDIEMPVMDGFESSSKIRAMEGKYFKDVPILAFTASEVKEVKAKAFRHGMNDIINKPIVTEELREKISKYFYVKKKLSIDFNIYTDGDQNFKNELVSLMIDNINELRQALLSGVREFFYATCHKVKATLTMLDDKELSAVVEELKSLDISNGSANGVNEKYLIFNGLCNEVIENLSAEINTL